MIVETIVIAWGGAAFVMFIAYCSGAKWGHSGPAERPDAALQELEDLDR